MRWVLAGLVMVLAVGCATERTLSGPDLECPDVTLSAFLDGDGSDAVATPREALGDRLAHAVEVTDESNDDKGFETVTFRGYDADGELLSRVVVEGHADQWRVARVDTCE